MFSCICCYCVFLWEFQSIPRKSMTFVGNSWLLLWWMTEADQRCSAKIGVLKKMQYSQAFSCEICQIFKNSYFEEQQTAVSRMRKLRSWGRFNNYVTLKLSFLTHLPPPPPYHHALSRLFTRTSLRHPSA